MSGSAVLISVLVYFIAGFIFATGVTDEGIEFETDETDTIFPKAIARAVVACFWPVLVIMHWFSPLGAK